HGRHEVRSQAIAEPPVRSIVDGDRRRTVAPPETGHRRHGHLGRRTVLCRSRELAEKHVPAAQPAGEIRAYPDVEGRGRLESEMREEGREAVQVVGRDAELRGEYAESGWR